MGAAAAEPTPRARTFTLGEVRAAAPIRTYRLERAYYDHLVGVARDLAAHAGAAPDAAVTIGGIAPPVRPTVTLDVTGAPRLGDADAAVTVVVVESLAQIHSQRLDRELQTLRRTFGARLALVHLPFVQPTHRSALPAAAAARCAHRQGRFWTYRGLVLADLQRQDRSALLEHARRLALDLDAFGACLDDDGTRAAVLDTTAAARAAGITRPPVVTVNGVYFDGSEHAAIAAAVADTAGTGRAAPVPPVSTLPLAVSGIVLLPGRPAEAIVVERATGRGRIVTLGDRLAATAVVTDILPDAVIVDHAGTRERLPLARAAGVDPSADAPQPSDRALVDGDAVTLTIDSDLRVRLRAARAGVEAQFSPGSLDVAGRRLLKLTGTEHADLFGRLGLAPGDVVLRVDDEWIFHGDGTFVERVTAPPPVTLVVMRRGLPRLIELVGE